MGPLRAPHVTWGSALLAQNHDDVVRCDGCDRAAVVDAGGRDALIERLLWPVLACVFDARCRGTMQREWLN